MDFYNPVPGLVPTSPANRNYDDGFQCGLIKKDMGLALDLAKSCGADSTMLEKSMNYY
jgi:3-hydroxyisobutyrate dehydrogenase